MARLTIETTQFQLGNAVTGSRSLTQQLQTDSAIAGIAAITAENLTKAALRLNHTLACRLLEQTAGNPLYAGGMPQTRAIQQPGSKTDRHLSTDGKRMKIEMG